jgi:hypothetical protein
MKKKLINVIAITAVVIGAGNLAAYAYGQYYGPVVNIGERHGNMRRAQESLVAAYQAISDAQAANDGQLGGHAARAKDLITQADYEIRQAANVSNREGR